MQRRTFKYRIYPSKSQKRVLENTLKTCCNLYNSALEETGGKIVFVNPAYTSQTCPECGKIKPKTLKERQHICSCGCTMDRDVAAAKIIETLGLQSLEQVSS